MAQQKQDRPVFHGEMGTRLKKCRDRKGWSVQQAVIAARSKHGSALTSNRLRWLEEGKTKMPDADVLRAVADIYELSYEEIATYFIAESYGNDLVRHEGTGQQGRLSKGASDALTSARRRILELEGQVDQLSIYKTVITRVRPLLADAITALGGEGDQAAGGKAARSGGH